MMRSGFGGYPERVRHAIGRTALAVALAAIPGLAPVPGRAAEAPEFGQDSLLVTLVAEAIARRPELAQARSTLEAERARVPVAGAWPDPVLTLGVQNDGFKRLQIGEMEQSWWSLGAAQTIPWRGKSGLRERLQTLGARQSEADLERDRLTIRAEVERAYLDLLLVRDQLEILRRVEALWIEADGLARSRYEVGEGAQSDMLRAQLERARLRQQRLALVAEEQRRRVGLDLAVGRPLDQPLETRLRLADLADPLLPDSVQAEAELEARSPELQKARLAVEESGARVDLARKDWFPDLTLSGSVMLRGSAFDPMWQAGVAVPLPLWGGRKQSNAVDEARLRGRAAQEGAEAIRRLLRQRLADRRVMLAAALEVNRLYRAGLLLQTEATVTSTIAQYQVGRVPFAAVLEALNGYWSDRGAYLESVAAALRLDIAQRELSVDPVAGALPGGAGGATLPGAGGMGPAAGPARGAGPAPAATPSTPAMTRM